MCSLYLFDGVENKTGYADSRYAVNVTVQFERCFRLQCNGAYLLFRDATL